MESCSCQLHLQRVQTLSGSKHSKSWFFTCYTWHAARRNADRLTFHAGQQWHDASIVQEELNLIAISSIFFRGLRPHLSTIIARCFSIHPQVVFAFCEGNSLTAIQQYFLETPGQTGSRAQGLVCCVIRDTLHLGSFAGTFFITCFFLGCFVDCHKHHRGKIAGSCWIRVVCVCACLFCIYNNI